MQIQKAQQFGFLAANQKSNTALSKILEKLSTGKQINRASDDAAGLAVAEQLMTQVRGYQSATTNVDYAQAAQYIAEGTGNEVNDMLQRQRELAVQASNGTLTNDQRAMLNQEYQQINQEMTRISKSSQFNGQNVAAGNDLGAGNGTVLAAANPGSNISIQGANFTSENLGTASTDLSTPANAANALKSVDNAMQNLSQQRTNIGANINRMDYAKAGNEAATNNSQEAESRIRDLDYAQGVMEQTRQNLLNQTSLAAMKNFNQINGNNMLFLME